MQSGDPKGARRDVRDVMDEKATQFRDHQRKNGQPDPGPDAARKFIQDAVRKTRTQDERDRK